MQSRSANPPPLKSVAFKVVMGGLFCLALATPLYVKFMPTLLEFAKGTFASREPRSRPPKPPGPLSMSNRIALTKLGNDLVVAISSGNVGSVSASLSTEALVARMLASSKEPAHLEKLESEFRRALAGNSAKKTENWLHVYSGLAAAFVRVAEREGFPLLILRLTTDRSVVYYGFMVMFDGGTPKIMDAYNFSTGLYRSEQIAERVVLLLSDPGIAGRLLGDPGLDKAMLDVTRQIDSAWNEQRFDQLLKLCDSLPARYQTNKNIFSLRLDALAHLSENSQELKERYQSLLNQAPVILGKDATTGLLLVEQHMNEGNYAEAETALQQAEDVIGADAYLKMLRANLRLLQNDPDAAERLTKEAERMDMYLEDLIYVKLKLLVLRRDFSAMVQSLALFEAVQRKSFNRSFLEEHGEYAEFLASAAYQEWARRKPPVR